MFRRRRGRVWLALGEEEAGLLRRLIGDYLELLDAESEPDDPVLSRLFPSASLDDPELQRQFRELLGSDLEQHKRSSARRALDSLGSSGASRGALESEEDSEAWLVTLTDLRLALGVRLGVTEEMWATLPDPRDPEQLPLAILHYLGGLQESLVRALRA
jgi:hypothetical protein